MSKRPRSNRPAPSMRRTLQFSTDALPSAQDQQKALDQLERDVLKVVSNFLDSEHNQSPLQAYLAVNRLQKAVSHTFAMLADQIEETAEGKSNDPRFGKEMLCFLMATQQYQAYLKATFDTAEEHVEVIHNLLQPKHPLGKPTPAHPFGEGVIFFGTMDELLKKMGA